MHTLLRTAIAAPYCLQGILPVMPCGLSLFAPPTFYTHAAP